MIQNEQGRSLIEVIGVLAVVGMMAAASLAMFSALRNNQTRRIAIAEIEQIARNTKLLLEMRGDYSGLSVEYLVKAGALKSDVPPIGGSAWSVKAESDPTMFSINLVDLNQGECEYFATSPHEWALIMRVNGIESDTAVQCFKSGTNQISFIVQ